MDFCILHYNANFINISEMPSFMDYITVPNKIGILINGLNNLLKSLKKRLNFQNNF